MLRGIGAYLLAGVALLVSANAFRQVPNEFRSTEPGSLLFGLLQIVIGTATASAAVGLVLRARWASWALGIGGVAAMGLLVTQPLYEPMPWDSARGIWIGAALVGAVAGGMSWCARRLARPAVGVNASVAPTTDLPPA